MHCDHSPAMMYEFLSEMGKDTSAAGSRPSILSDPVEDSLSSLCRWIQYASNFQKLFHVRTL